MKAGLYLLVVTALGGALLAACSSSGTSSEGTAGGVPGRVEQTTQATDAGITVEVQHVDYSGGGVVVTLFASSTEGNLAMAGIPLSRAELEGVHGASGRTRGDGTQIIRFPAEAAKAWADGTSTTANLSITAVNTMSLTEGIQPTFGQWDLVIELPTGDVAEEARTVEELEPVIVDLVGREVTVEALLTPAETIIRTYLPPDFRVLLSQLALEVDGQMVTPRDSHAADESAYEHRFDPIRTTGDLTLTFPDVVTVEPLDSPWTVNLMLEPYAIPAFSSDTEVIQEKTIGWTADSTASAPEVLRVLVRRVVNDVRMEVEFDGSSWLPGPRAPLVTGDGTRLRVVGAGHGTPNGVSISDVVMELPADETPTDIRITVSQTEKRHPPVKVTFER